MSMTLRREVGLVWRAQARELAQWTAQRLVCRRDLWAHCLPLRRQSPQCRVKPARGRLSMAQLELHYAGDDVRELVALPCLSDPADTAQQRHCRWFSVHVTPHGEADPARPGDCFQAAVAWYEKLRTIGLSAILEADGAPGSYRLLVIFDEPAPAAAVAQYVDKLVSDFADRDLYHRPWTLPHRSESETGEHSEPGATCWLHLPGRHPWALDGDAPACSRIWSGSEWLEAAEAIAALLATPTTSPALLHRSRAATASRSSALPARPRRTTPTAPPTEPTVRLKLTPPEVASHAEVAPHPEVVTPPEVVTTLKISTPADAVPSPQGHHAANASDAPAHQEPFVMSTATSTRPSSAPPAIDLPDEAAQTVAQIAQRTGMREQEVLRRVLSWVAEQNEVVQAVILGQIPESIRPNIWRLIQDAQPARSTAAG